MQVHGNVASELLRKFLERLEQKLSIKMGETATARVGWGGGDGARPGWPSRNYLVYVDAVVQRPHGLEVILHPVLEFARHLVQRQEVLEVPPLALVQRPPGVHALYDGRHVTEHHSVHER